MIRWLVLASLLFGSSAWALTMDELDRVLRKQYPSNKSAYRIVGHSIEWMVWEGPGMPPTYAEAQALVVSSPAVNRQGFTAWLKANMTFALRNSIHTVYPTFCSDLAAGRWDDFQAGVLLAKTGVPLTNGQWTAFKNAVATYNIPVTLP